MNNFAQLTQYKTEIMNSFRFCKRVYEGGIETPEQFDSFTNLCQNHVDKCNMICKKLKPKFSLLQWKKAKNFINFKETCAYTISEIQIMINEIQSGYDKLEEIEELRETMAIKARIEYEIANELKEVEIERQADIRESRQIGFSLPIEEIDTEELNKIETVLL